MNARFNRFYFLHINVWKRRSALILIFFWWCVIGLCAVDDEYYENFIEHTKEILTSEERNRIEKIESSNLDLYSKYLCARKIWNERADKMLIVKLSKYSTNGISGSAIIKPWATMVESIKYLWSSESRQRYDGRMSLALSLSALKSLKEIKRRIDDPEDDLKNISIYGDVLSIPGMPGKIYWWIEELYWKGDIEKAKEGMEFLQLPNNKDGFVRGASLFFLGRINMNTIPQNCLKRDLEELALSQLIRVHEYPTCLTYISLSYIMSSDIYDRFGFLKQALALLMIDVPSIDIDDMICRRNEEAAKICLKMGQITNSVRHLHEVWRYGNDEQRQRVSELLDSSVRIRSLWSNYFEDVFTEHDKDFAIFEAISDAKEIPNYEEMRKALLHKWPKVSDLPPGMATNRVLNNNYLTNKQ